MPAGAHRADSADQPARLPAAWPGRLRARIFPRHALRVYVSLPLLPPGMTSRSSRQRQSSSPSSRYHVTLFVSTSVFLSFLQVSRHALCVHVSLPLLSPGMTSRSSCPRQSFSPSSRYDVTLLMCSLVFLSFLKVYTSRSLCQLPSSSTFSMTSRSSSTLSRYYVEPLILSFWRRRHARPFLLSPTNVTNMRLDSLCQPYRKFDDRKREKKA